MSKRIALLPKSDQSINTLQTSGRSSESRRMTDMTNRKSITRAFLWLAALVGGPLVGAKLFDLLVLAGAWSAHPPQSLAMMPYGKAWPVDTGFFFIPFSAAMLIAGFGALT